MGQVRRGEVAWPQDHKQPQVPATTGSPLLHPAIPRPFIAALPQSSHWPASAHVPHL